MKDLLGLPGGASVGFVTGAQAANTVGIACGRHRVLEQAGYDVETDGLVGAPRVRVVTGSERHATIDRSLRLLGLGTASLVPVLTDDHGTIDLADLEQVLGQRAGPADDRLPPGRQREHRRQRHCSRAAVPLAKEAGAWVHVDGAFGLWAAAGRRPCAPGRRRRGGRLLGHRRPQVAQRAVRQRAGDRRRPGGARTVDGVLRGVPRRLGPRRLLPRRPGPRLLAPRPRLRGLGGPARARPLRRRGPRRAVRACSRPGWPTRLAEGGATIANDVVLNQVLVGFGRDDSPPPTRSSPRSSATVRAGSAPPPGTSQRLIRISVSNATTTEHDIDRSADAILAAAAGGVSARVASAACALASVLRDQEFLRYFASRLLSVAGSIVTLVTLPIIVYRTSGSASLTALVAAARRRRTCCSGCSPAR